MYKVLNSYNDIVAEYYRRIRHTTTFTLATVPLAKAGCTAAGDLSIGLFIKLFIKSIYQTIYQTIYNVKKSLFWSFTI